MLINTRLPNARQHYGSLLPAFRCQLAAFKHPFGFLHVKAKPCTLKLSRFGIKKASQRKLTGLISPERIRGCLNCYYSLEAFSDRYLATPSGDAPIPALPFSHCAGQTSPCSSWNCSASTIRSISSMLRPSGRSLTTW